MSAGTGGAGRGRPGPGGTVRRVGAVFAVGLGFWLLLAPHHTPLALGLGVAAAGLVAWANRDGEAVSEVLAVAPRFLGYLPWLLRAVAVANLEVVRLVLSPRLPVDPVVVRVGTALRGDLAVTALANSITLTPGTVTLDVGSGELVVHALTRAGAAEVAGGAMERRIARAFGESGAA